MSLPFSFPLHRDQVRDGKIMLYTAKTGTPLCTYA